MNTPLLKKILLILLFSCIILISATTTTFYMRKQRREPYTLADYDKIQMCRCSSNLCSESSCNTTAPYYVSNERINLV